jgi:hypothetical protein
VLADQARLGAGPNHTIATPTNPVNSSHRGLCTSDSADTTEMLIPTAS